MEWSIPHTLNNFLYRHDAVEDPLLVYINISEALSVAALVLVFLFANGERLRPWRRAAVAAVSSAGLALVIAKIVSEIVERARPFVVDPNGVHLFSRAVLGCGVALVLFIPRLRSQIDRLADLVGGWIESAVHIGRAGSSSRPNH